MQPSGNFAKILIAIISVVILTIIVSAILYFSKEDEVKKMTTEEISKVLSLDERAGGIIAESIAITFSDDNFTRGKLIDSSTGEEKDFYLIKIGEVWRVVEITDRPVSCERFARLGFPNVFIQDCQLTFSDAVTLSEIDYTLDDFFKSSENFDLKIIATVEDVQDTEEGQIITVNSGGEIIQIKLSIEDPAIKEGDLIVTKITAPNSKSQSNSIYQSNNPIIVNENDRDLIDTTSSQSNVQQQNNQMQDPQANKIYKINAPKTYAPPSYFKNIDDVDNSFVNIELEGSF